MKVSVITVVYNAANAIGETLESVFAQRGADVEIESIVVDGGSTDGTVEVVKAMFSGVASAGNLTCRLISERDEGIYDAMNKGIRASSGEWVNFMNAGDVFSSNKAVSDLLHGVGNLDDVDVVFGNARRIEGRTITEEYAGDNYSLLKRGLYFRHNAALVRRQTHLKFLYALSLKKRLTFSLDSEAFHRMFVHGVRFQFVNVNVVDYLREGASNNIPRHAYNNFLIQTEFSPTLVDWIRFVPRLIRAVRFFQILFIGWERVFLSVRRLFPQWLLPESIALRLMLAKVGRDVHFAGRIKVKAPHFLTIGNGVSIGRNCVFDATAKIWIGDSATIPDGTRLLTSHRSSGRYSVVQKPVFA